MMCKSSGSTGCSSDPILLADAMLGRLAVWLRLIGFDTLYAGRLPGQGAGAGARSDHQIAARARAEGRIVLTRDREMARRRGIRCLYVESQVLEEQLAQVIAALGTPCAPTPRCPQCNEPLADISPMEARPYVPAYVWKTHARFQRCSECDKVYWPGSHWERIEKTIARVMDQVD
jgi:uncharacterized protein with PIN domain